MAKSPMIDTAPPKVPIEAKPRHQFEMGPSLPQAHPRKSASETCFDDGNLPFPGLVAQVASQPPARDGFVCLPRFCLG